VFEDLQVKSMVKNHALAKAISDAAWDQLVEFTEYKAERAGRMFVTVPALYTTRECFFCGTINSVNLSAREFVCKGCGRTLDRDINSGRVVLARGIAKVGQDKVPGRSRSGGESHHQVVPELKPVETGPLSQETTLWQARSLNQELHAAHHSQPLRAAGSHRIHSVEDVTKTEEGAWVWRQCERESVNCECFPI
jgi:putative transposase